MKKHHYMLICGGRDYADYSAMQTHVAAVAKKVASAGGELHIVSGGAKGADTLAANAADKLDIDSIVIHPDWEKHGKSAGFKRNERMAAYLTKRVKAGATACVVAFPGGVGTDMMRDISHRVGLKVYSSPV